MRRTLTWITVLALTISACTSTSANEGPSEPSVGSDVCPTEGGELETAMLYIEHNAADEDTGVHSNVGGEPWVHLCLRDPSGAVLVEVKPQGPLGALGLSDYFAESNEPPNDEYSIADLRGDFPEGEYLVAALGEDGEVRVKTAQFTHAIPAPPAITAPDLVEDEEQAGTNPIPSTDLAVSWEEVTSTIDGDAVEITGYQVIITTVEHDDPNGFSRPVYDVHVGPDARSLTVADAFLEPDTLYELEVLAIEVSGNQTIGLGFFSTQ